MDKKFVIRVKDGSGISDALSEGSPTRVLDQIVMDLAVMEWMVWAQLVLNQGELVVFCLIWKIFANILVVKMYFRRICLFRQYINF